MRQTYRLVLAPMAAAAALWSPSAARAGGTPENAFLIIDPTDPNSLQIGNYYKNARNIPDSNVLYLRAAATNYAEFKTTPQRAFLDTLTQRGLTRIDYVVLAPLNTYNIPAPNQVTDGCFPVSLFSIASCFTLSQISSTITVNTPSTLANQFFSSSETATFFSGSQGYLNGVAATGGATRRYYIGALLGYISPFGNSIDEIKAMIDRSAAVDGTRPIGTFYFMNTTDVSRNVRQPGYPPAITQITQRGGSAVQLDGTLPENRSDVIGIMSGMAFYDAAAANMVIRPGAFCDNLTSSAGVFSTGQTPMSVWIANGASGTAGTVDEPCNYLGKFPSPRFHQWYFQGMSLGEAYLRSVAYAPFQSQLYGDPLCRPWAFFPTLTVAAPATDTPVSRIVTFNVTARPTAPSALIGSMDLVVDGVVRSTISSGTGVFSLDTRQLDDGWHDVRVTARDTSPTRNVGRWTSSILVRNHGRAVGLAVSPAQGDLSQGFTFTPAPSGGGVARVRLLQSGRTIAAGVTADPLTVYGANLGAGLSNITAEVTYADGRVARSAPVAVTVADSAPDPGATVPVAFDTARRLTAPTVHVVELPAAFPHAPGTATFTLLSNPASATVINPTFTGGYRLIRPNIGATGSETLQYRVQAPGGQSNIGTITLLYSAARVCQTDFNVDGVTDPDDLSDFISCFFDSPPCEGADYNLDGFTDPDDLSDYIAGFFGASC